MESHHLTIRDPFQFESHIYMRSQYQNLNRLAEQIQLTEVDEPAPPSCPTSFPLLEPLYNLWVTEVILFL